MKAQTSILLGLLAQNSMQKSQNKQLGMLAQNSMLMTPSEQPPDHQKTYQKCFRLPILPSEIASAFQDSYALLTPRHRLHTVPAGPSRSLTAQPEPILNKQRTPSYHPKRSLHATPIHPLALCTSAGCSPSGWGFKERSAWHRRSMVELLLRSPGRFRSPFNRIYGSPDTMKETVQSKRQPSQGLYSSRAAFISKGNRYAKRTRPMEYKEGKNSYSNAPDISFKKGIPGVQVVIGGCAYVFGRNEVVKVSSAPLHSALSRYPECPIEPLFYPKPEFILFAA